MVRYVLLSILIFSSTSSFAQEDFPPNTARFPGGKFAMHQFIIEHLTYPYSREDSVEGVEKKTIVKFVVDQDGQISNVGILQSSLPKFDSSAASVIRAMPAWEIAPDSKPSFRFKCAVPMLFRLDKGSEDSEVHTIADIQPAFPGGQESMIRFILTNLRYPNQARRMGTEGKVFIQFVVNKDGSISNIQAIKGISLECDKEAERVIGLMPPWSPGQQNGKTVRVKYVVPINFKLTTYRGR